MDYKQKYLKYKKKYIDLKIQIAGSSNFSVTYSSSPGADAEAAPPLSPGSRKVSGKTEIVNLLDNVKIKLNEGVKTVVLLDGLHNTANVATVVRNGTFLGATDIFICPSKALDDEIISVKNFIKYKDSNKVYYNTNFKQRVGKMSYNLAHTRSKQCVNIYYNFTSLDIIKIAEELGYIIFLLENDATANIVDYLKDESKNLFKKDKVLFIVGNEKEGVDKEIIIYISEKIKKEIPNFKFLYIPSCLEVINHNSNSYNVAQAANIAIYTRLISKPCIKTTCDDKKYGVLLDNLDKNTIGLDPYNKEEIQEIIADKKRRRH